MLMETQQLIGEDTVRAVSMDSTDGLFARSREGMGQPIAMPVGDAIKGRLFNVGQPIDGHEGGAGQDPTHPPRSPEVRGPHHQHRGAVHRHQGDCDLIEPYAKGGKIGLFGGAGVARPCSSRS